MFFCLATFFSNRNYKKSLCHPYKGEINTNRDVSCLNISISAAFFVLLVIGIMLVPMVVTAKVVKVEINSREVVSTSPERMRSGPYEVIKGIIYLEVDPNDPANQLIVDLKLAERNGRGNVEFSTEFELHKPIDANRGNHRLMYFVNNRGYKMGTWDFNHQAGKNWLYSQGYSYLWCDWNCDVIKTFTPGTFF